MAGTAKSIAVLVAEFITAVGSQTAPDSITPGVLEAALEDALASYFNQVDGISVGIQGRTIKTAGQIPALYNGLNDGDPLETIIAQILIKTDATQIAVTGGIQGNAGEFVATINADTQQTILVNETITARGTYRKVAIVNLINDESNGSFDNGNNYQLNTFKTPLGGQASIAYYASGLSLNILNNGLSSSTATRTFKYVIAKNGTPLNIGVGPTKIESNEIAVTVGDPTGKLYFNDFSTLLGAASIAASAADEFTLELWEKSNAAALASDTLQVQLTNGCFNNKII